MGIKVKPMAAAGLSFVIGLKSNGTVIAIGDNRDGECNVSAWTDIVAVTAGTFHSVGLKSNGTVVATGENKNGACNVSSWTDIKAIAAGYGFTLGLKSNGTVVATGYLYNGNVSAWTDIVAIKASYVHMAGLKSNGTVVMTGQEYSGEFNVSAWTDIVDIDSGTNFTVGLKSNGAVVYAGNEDYYRTTIIPIISSWTDIVAIAAGNGFVIGLKSNGTVVTAGNTRGKFDPTMWTNITNIDCDSDLTVGLRKNGTVAVVDSNEYGQCNIQDWKLKLDYTGLLKSRKALDFSKADYVDAFQLDGILPADCKKKLAFKVDDKYYKLTQTSGTAALTTLTTQAITADSIFSEGNTVEEVAACTNNVPFVGKQVYPVIAMYAPDNATVYPSVKLTANARNKQDSYTKEEYSAEYAIATTADKVMPRIIDITPAVTVKGKATAKVTVSIKTGDTWSEYTELTAAKDKQCSAVKYKAVYNVTTLDGSDSAKVDSVTVRYANGSAAVSGDTAEIYSITENYEDGLQYCQALIKHKALIDSKIKAYISFRAEPQQRKMVSIGTGNGKEQTLILGVSGVADTGINQNKLNIYIDGKPFYSYSYNTETSEVTLTVDNGVAISATYEYGWEPEKWLEMTAGAVEPYHDNSSMYSSRFTYTLADTSVKKTISNVKFVLYRPSGHVDSASLGKATGNRQVMVLPHQAKKETIVCNGSWSYDEDTQVLTVVATKDTDLVISYDWVGESQEVYGYTAGWSVVA